jgi:hypothetical protein
MARYEIGGMCVDMTEGAAKRWNSGDATTHDLAKSRVFIPRAGNQCDAISLRRATNSRLAPEVAVQLFGMPANEA